MQTGADDAEPIASDDDPSDVGAEAARQLRGVSLKKRPKPQSESQDEDADAKRMAPSITAALYGGHEAHTYRVLVPAAHGQAAVEASREVPGCTVTLCDPVAGCDELVVECTSSASTDSGDVFPAQATVLAVLRACLVDAGDGGATTLEGAAAPAGNSGEDAGVTAQSTATVVARVLVPASQAGAIIGRAGDNIRAVRQASGAVVRVLEADETPRCASAVTSSSVRVVQITGSWPQAAAALDVILPKLREFSHRRASGGGGSPATGIAPGSASPARSGSGTQTTLGPAGGMVTSFSAHIAVPSTSVGSIIGKGGANIAQIRSISGARIKVHDAVKGASQRHIEISGTAEQVGQAQVLVQGFLMTCLASPPGMKMQTSQAYPQAMQLVTAMPQPQLMTAMPVMMAPPGYHLAAPGGAPGMPALVLVHPGGAAAPTLGYPAPMQMPHGAMLYPQFMPQ